jgi:hypothetical protein
VNQFGLSPTELHHSETENLMAQLSEWLIYEQPFQVLVRYLTLEQLRA